MRWPAGRSKQSALRRRRAQAVKGHMPHDEMQNLVWGGLHKPRTSLLRFAHASHKHHGLQGAIVEPHVELNNGAPRLHEAEAHKVRRTLRRVRS